MEKKWEIVDTEYLVKSRYLTCRRDRVRLPDGRVNPEYYVLEFPDWVNVIAITRDGRMVMVRQYRHGLGVYQTELCAGYIDPKDVSPLAAARRELEEETGFTGGEWEEFMTLSANPANHNNLTHVFIARGVEQKGHQQLDVTEDLRYVLMEQKDVLSMMERGELQQALMLAPLWRYFGSLASAR